MFNIVFKAQGAGQVQGRRRVLFLGRVLKLSTTGRKKF